MTVRGEHRRGVRWPGSLGGGSRRRIRREARSYQAGHNAVCRTARRIWHWHTDPRVCVCVCITTCGHGTMAVDIV